MTTDVNCKYNNQTYENGQTFRSLTGRSTYICDYGVINKQGEKESESEDSNSPKEMFVFQVA